LELPIAFSIVYTSRSMQVLFFAYFGLEDSFFPRLEAAQPTCIPYSLTCPLRLRAANGTAHLPCRPARALERSGRAALAAGVRVARRSEQPGRRGLRPARGYASVKGESGLRTHPVKFPPTADAHARLPTLFSVCVTPELIVHELE
jgi:hypothetical protein